MFFIIIGLQSCTTETNDAKNSESNATPSVILGCEHCKHRFWAKHYTRSHTDTNTAKINITAEVLILRERQGRVIHFTNHDELYFKNLILESPLNTSIIQFDNTLLATANSTKQATPLEPKPAAQDMMHDNNLSMQSSYKIFDYVLTRLTVDHIKLIFKPPKQPAIIFTSNDAKMLIDSLQIKFTGNVQLKTKQCQISSSIALWSHEDNGLFFPESYRLNNKTYQKPALFQISNQGHCKKIHGFKPVGYDDPLELAEDTLFQTMPLSLRLLFGLFGTPASYDTESLQNN